MAYPMAFTMPHLSQFRQLVNNPQRVVVTTHYMPDADAMGSSLALAAYLKKKGHSVSVISPSDYPDFLYWMPGNGEVINMEAGNKKKARDLISQAGIIFCLDFNSPKRINNLGEMLGNARGVKVLIDHHLDPEPFAHFALWDVRAAATAELVFSLIISLGDRHLIDPGMAECLYAGIMTDTGQYKHPNTTRNVHLVTADLIELGADTARVGRLIYDNNSLDRLRFTGFALSERLNVLKSYRTAYFKISLDDLNRYKSRTGDTEGLVNYGLSLKGVVFSALIIERKDCIRLSLRSKGAFSVNEFAREHFDGGGHANAAGGTSELSLDETEKKFIHILKLYKDTLHENHQLEL